MEGNFYGISKNKNYWYVYNRFSHKSRLIKMNIPNDVNNIELEIDFIGLPDGCHQIDFINSHLVITDTYNNKLIEYDPQQKIIVREIYTNGKLENGRSSDNYVHCNSIFKYKKNIYLMYHNETAKTDRESEIAIVKDDFTFNKLLKVKASSAHNIYIKDDIIYFCDSLNKSFVRDKEILFECDEFTRGLSVSDDYIAIGGSEFAKRDQRKLTEGTVYLLDNKYSYIGKIKMPAPVYEIRRVDKSDYCFSNYN